MSNIAYRADCKTRIEAAFPKLASSSAWHPLSLDTSDYQCIAWAACDDTQRWWPEMQDYHWPDVPTNDSTVASFILGFKTLGYRRCKNPEFEFGYQKVAIYANDAKIVKHMARQQLFGKGWLSKLGDWEDIWHMHLDDLAGDTAPWPWIPGYGGVKQILKRHWIIGICVVLRQRLMRLSRVLRQRLSNP